MDYNKLLTTCLYLMDYSGAKTLSYETIKCALKILHHDDPNLQTLIKNGDKYLWAYANNEKINNYYVYQNIINNFMTNEAKNISYKVYKINKGSIAFLCGIGDTLTNQIQSFI